MTQQEFMERTGITPTAEDFDYIHAVYLNTSMNKDEFCKDFKKHGDSRIIRDVHVRVLNYEEEMCTSKGSYRQPDRFSDWQGTCV